MLSSHFIARNPTFQFIVVLFFLAGNFRGTSQNKPCPPPGDVDTTGIRCGNIFVREDHQNPKSRQISISYMVLKARDGSKNIPVIHFSGGPGGKSLGGVKAWSTNPLRNNHDIILFDQRGIGFSSPLPDISSRLLPIMAANLPPDGEGRLMKTAVEENLAEIKASGANAAMYNVFQNAHDVGKLMEELKYPKYNIFGVSYGTKLAQVVAKHYAGKINKMVLYGPAPLSVNFYKVMIPNYDNVLSEVLNILKSDYPTIESDFKKSMTDLKVKPIRVSYKEKPFWLNPQDVNVITRYILYRPTAKEVLPQWITALSRRDTTQMMKLMETPLQIFGGSNFSMYLSSMTYDELQPTSPQDFQTSCAKSVWTQDGLALLNSYVPLLPTWHSSRAKTEEITAVPSAIPTLLLVHKYDPATPRGNIQVVAKSFSNSRIKELDEYGHVSLDPGKMAIIGEYFQNQKE